MAPGIGGPNLDFQPREDLPEPPIRTRQRPAVARFGRLAFAAILAAVVAGGVTLVMRPGEVGKRAADVSAMVTALFDGSSRTRKPAKPARLVVENQKGFANEPLALGVTPTDASGAIADGDTSRRNPEGRGFLDRNDSYHYFQSLGDLVVTGPTNTNVMDVRVILVGVRK